MTKQLEDVVNFATSKAETEHYPTPSERRVRGAPMQEATTHFAADDRFFAGEWAADVGCWRVSYTEH